MRKDIIIRQESAKDYKEIVSLILRSFREGTNYSDGSDIIALIEEIRVSKYYIPESFPRNPYSNWIPHPFCGNQCCQKGRSRTDTSL